ncbi:hypothetical protein FHW88_001446 [Mucilaginibacter sp. SG538B]|nr:hypothetical protein [Mucilaginibacter sp. SG538B]
MNSSKLAESALGPLLRSAVMAAIWIPYFKKSSRVQETFIVPHPSYNYSYEGPGLQRKRHLELVDY